MKTGDGEIVRWCVETIDRIGMVRDIVAEVAATHGDVEAMEVVAGFIYIRFRLTPQRVSNLYARLKQVEGVKGIQVIDKLPFEADEELLVRRLLQQEGDASALGFENLTYVSEAMKKVVHIARTVAPSDAPIVITGESGTGKELLARAIHAASSRRGRRFVPMNCAAIPDSLLESELFGYVEGAFTGADRGGKPGLFEVADGGTLFLDEIGEMNLSVQAKVLRVLADGELRRVGATQTRRVSVRIIAATNRDLKQLIRQGGFREDLYYRLNVIPIEIPPLRKRREDIIPLVTRFLERMSRKLEREFHVTGHALQGLLKYDFPGNIRELQNMVERACYLNDGGAMRAEHFLLPSVADVSEQMGAVRTGGSLKERVRAFELALIQEAIQQAGSLRAAAKQLGTTHTALSNKLRSMKQE